MSDSVSTNSLSDVLQLVLLDVMDLLIMKVIQKYITVGEILVS